MLRTLTILFLGLAMACLAISQFPNPGPPVRYIATEYQPLTIAGQTYRAFGVRDVANGATELVLTDDNGTIVPR